jgi:ketosteroid isomerase-like protein
MRSVLCGFLLLAFLAGSAQTAMPQEAQQRRVLALEHAWDRAVREQDVKALDPLLGEDLIYVEYDGTVMNKAQYLADVRMPRRQFEHIVSDSMQVQSYGQSAVVVGVYREKGVENGKPYLHQERFVDTWINQNGAWICVASQSTLMLH